MLVGDRALRGALPVTALGAAEVGHWLVYRARFAEQPVPAPVQAAHAYFPALLTVVTAVLGAAVLAVLLLVAAARITAGRWDRRRVVRRPAFVDLWAALFVIQLAFFGVQELAEAAASGQAALSPVELLLWGVFGQLPASLLAAVLLRWAATRFETALARLQAGATAIAAHLAPSAPRLGAVPRSLAPQPANPSLHERGPPASSCSV